MAEEEIAQCMACEDWRQVCSTPSLSFFSRKESHTPHLNPKASSGQPIP